MTRGGVRIAGALREATVAGQPAVATFVTAGFPSKDGFSRLLREVASASDVLEVGIPFSDPMADGVTIQRASRTAIANGTSVSSVLSALAALAPSLATPVVLMSYFNPLLAYGLTRFSRDAADAGVSGLIVPDLPLEEQHALRPAMLSSGLALVQMVTPVTPDARLARLAALSEGFVYAVTVTGTTGGGLGGNGDLPGYLRRVRGATDKFVLAGFGVRTNGDVAALVPPADGVVVGSALIAALERGESAGAFLAGVRS
jgi:tryptophan synthase alpha chain